MKKSILLDKNKFNFLLERIENKYSYDEFKELSKSLLVESYRGKILKAISGIDEPKLVKKLKGHGLGGNQIEDVLNGIEFIKNPTNVNNHGFAPLLVSDEWIGNLQKGLDIDVIEIKSMKNGLKQLSDIHNSKLNSIKNKRNPVLEYVLDSGNLTPDEQIENVAGILEDYPDFFDDAIENSDLHFSNKNGSIEEWIYDSLDDGSAGRGRPSKLIDKQGRGDWINSKIEYNKHKGQSMFGEDGKPIKGAGGTEGGPVITKDSITKRLFKWLFIKPNKWYWDWIVYGGKKGKADPEKWFSKRRTGGVNLPTKSGSEGIMMRSAVFVAKIGNVTVMPALRGLIAHPYALVGFIVECTYKAGWEEDKIIEFTNELDSDGNPRTVTVPFTLGNCFGVPTTYKNLETGKVETYNPMMFPLFGWSPTPPVLGFLGVDVIGAGVSMLLEPFNPIVSQSIETAQIKIDKIFADKGFLELLHTECTEETIKNRVNEILSDIKSQGTDSPIAKWFAKFSFGFELDKLSEEDTQLFLEVLGSVDGGVEVFKEIKKGINPYLPENLKNKKDISLSDILMAYCNKKRIELLVESSGEVTHKLSNIVVKDDVSKNKNETLCEEFKLWKRFSCPMPTDLDNCVPSLTECNKNKDLMVKVVTMVNNDENLNPDFTDTLFDINLWVEGCKRFNNNYNENVGDWVCNLPQESTPENTDVDLQVDIDYEEIFINENSIKYKYSWETELQVYTVNDNGDKLRKNKIDTCNSIQTYANLLNARNFKNNKVPLFSDAVAWKNEYGETMYDIKVNNEVLKEFQSHFCVVGKINDPQSTVEQCKSELKTIFDGLTCSGAQKL